MFEVFTDPLTSRHMPRHAREVLLCDRFCEGGKSQVDHVLIAKIGRSMVVEVHISQVQ